MYLTTIDPKTGLVILDGQEDGILAISDFRAVIDDKDLGLECFTAIALTADYQSILRYYSDNDRPKKAMEEVVGNRNAWPWPIEKIQVALKKYDELQYDPTAEEGKIHYQRKVNKLREYKDAEEKFDKKNSDGEKVYPDVRAPSIIAKELRDINSDIAEYEKQIQGKDVFANSPVKNGYTLSRLEQKLLKKNSFYSSAR